MNDDLPPKATVEAETKDMTPEENKVEVSTPAAETPLKPATKPQPPTIPDHSAYDVDETDYALRVIEGLTIDYKPTIVICSVSEDVKPGKYFIQNINSVMVRGQLMVVPCFYEYRGDRRIELVVNNMVDEWYQIKKNFTIAKLVEF